MEKKEEEHTQENARLRTTDRQDQMPNRCTHRRQGRLVSLNTEGAIGQRGDV